MLGKEVVLKNEVNVNYFGVIYIKLIYILRWLGVRLSKIYKINGIYLNVKILDRKCLNCFKFLDNLFN